MGGGGGQEVDNDPWGGQQPYLHDLFNQAHSLYGSGVGQQYYPGNTVAPFSDPTQMGFDMLMNRAGGTPGQGAMGGYLGNSLMSSGTDPLMATAYGGFLGSNPYLDSVYDRGASQITDSFNQEIMPGLNATFGGGGRADSGLHQLYAGEAAGEAQDALGNLAASIYAPAYESERDRMMGAAGDLSQQALGAAGLMPTYDQMQRTNIQDVLNVGGALEDQSQRLIDADMARWNFGQQSPWQALGQYGNIVQGMPSGYGTTTTDPGSGSRIAGGVGGAMMGYGLSSIPAFAGVGAWPLAIGGGLLGMM